MQMPGTQSQIQEVKPIAPLQQVSLTEASAQELEKHADQLREEKNYLDAIDYYEASIKKKPDAIIYNKIGMTYLSMGNLDKA